jgi:hypothetical protein
MFAAASYYLGHHQQQQNQEFFQPGARNAAASLHQALYIRN